MLETSNDPMDGRWTHYPHFLKPDEVFTWAAPGRAYAAQIVKGPSGKFYLYAPVVHAAATTRDKFAIGVAVADTPLGPWVDAHPGGPVVSQAYPVANDIQNIDPTVLVDDDGRVFLYWGTFGRLKGVELERDMVTFKGAPVDVRTLNGFFEAAWVFKRNGTYYMAYAANTAGPTSECTEAVYYACIAYGTSPSPLGPWTYRGVILDPVSSTTSHPGIVGLQGTRGTSRITRPTRRTVGTFVAQSRSIGSNGTMASFRRGSRRWCRRAVLPSMSHRSRTSRRMRALPRRTFRSQYSTGCAR
jgi:hypothetical protein